MASPAIVIYVFVVSSGPLGPIWAVPFALMAAFVGWLAYGACYLMVCQLFWPKHVDPDAAAINSKPTVTATLLLAPVHI